MKKRMEEPKLEFVRFDCDDVIMTSGFMTFVWGIAPVGETGDDGQYVTAVGYSFNDIDPLLDADTYVYPQQ